MFECEAQNSGAVRSEDFENFDYANRSPEL